MNKETILLYLLLLFFIELVIYSIIQKYKLKKEKELLNIKFKILKNKMNIIEKNTIILKNKD